MTLLGGAASKINRSAAEERIIVWHPIPAPRGALECVPVRILRMVAGRASHGDQGTISQKRSDDQGFKFDSASGIELLELDIVRGYKRGYRF